MAWHPLRDRKATRLAAIDAYRVRRRLVREDVTVFGEKLAGLHVETLTTSLDEEMRLDYQQALDEYDAAKLALANAESEAELESVTAPLRDGNYYLACVLARRDGTELPMRREPCFFNPQHGPAAMDLSWTPPGGVERDIPVCRSCSIRLGAGERPDVRLVRAGDGYVPWWEAPKVSAQTTMDVVRRSGYRWDALDRAYPGGLGLGGGAGGGGDGGG